ncbi:MAG: hypothetical protein IPL59_19845 [Candidatus Competibacteraceae bacterium]|nr:hypothetical protein [Candidatus Competibacteraceae bacterium]
MIERALQQGKQDVGLGDYQVRGWRGWHHHLALVMMSMLFLLEERPAPPSDSTATEWPGYSGVVEPFPAAAGDDVGGGPPPDGDPPPKTASGYQFSLSQTTT